MNAKSASEAYVREAVQTAPPIKILRMLYQGAIRALAQAIAAGAEDASFVERIGRADQIVTELRLALRPEFGEEQCQHLENLYVFVEGRLLDGLKQRSVEPLADARVVLETLLEAWNQVEIETGGLA